MVIVGSQRMVQYDDTAADEAVRVFDRGMDFEHADQLRRVPAHATAAATSSIPRVDAAEPLSLELEDFAHAIRTGATPRSHAELGLEIVAAIEAAEESLRRGGQPVMLRGTAGAHRRLAELISSSTVGPDRPPVRADHGDAASS